MLKGKRQITSLIFLTKPHFKTLATALYKNSDQQEKRIMKTSKAVFAGGNFWNVQSIFKDVPGVLSTLVGYTGGSKDNPTYKEVAEETTGHAEAVEITFNPDIVSFDRLLDIFFASHNPTTPNRQGPDTGTRFRSAVFYQDDDQRLEALLKIAKLQRLKVFAVPIVTQVVPAARFYPAETYHQHYMQQPGQTSCNLY